MKLKNFLLAWYSLIKKKLSPYFSIKIIIKAFVISFLISNFIYFSILNSKILDFISPFLAIFGFYELLKSNKFHFFWSGFFVGILWFYWISFSLIYYDLSFLIPVEILAIAIIYGLMFLLAGLPSQIWLKAVLLILIYHVHIFNFNWLNFEAIFIIGPFRADFFTLILIFTAILALIYIKNKIKFVVFFAILSCCIQYQKIEFKTLPFEIELTNTQIHQGLKWKKELKNKFINENLSIINKAIDEQKSVIVLPESAFALFMSHERNLVNELKEKSKNITIITGALAYENNNSYNSAFLFQDGKMSRFDKFILVPFGEEVPLPNFAKNLINSLFFDGHSDFSTAKNVSDYDLQGYKIRNAICYEATRDELFRGEFDAMIAITNNGWFVPSIEPKLQEILLKYYATKYKKAIYHSVNGSNSQIITPKQPFFTEILQRYF
ncbi:MAG: apolipoprotein N-acyltransferase [Campylobacter sp.]